MQSVIIAHLLFYHQAFMDNTTALKKAIAIQNNAANYRFEWKQLEPVFDKLNEEVSELKQAINDNNKDEIKSELGDVLFVVANLARLLDIDPDVCLEKTNTKFNNRFNFVLQALNISNNEHNQTLDAMQQQWQHSKKVFP